MMGRLERAKPLFTTLRLDELVPCDYLLRRIDRLLDFGPLVAELKAPLREQRTAFGRS